MKTHEPVWSPRRRRQLSDAERGRVGGEHGLGADDVVELGEHLALGVEVFHNRLDHQIRVGQIRGPGSAGQVGQRPVAVLGADLVPCHATG